MSRYDVLLQNNPTKPTGKPVQNELSAIKTEELELDSRDESSAFQTRPRVADESTDQLTRELTKESTRQLTRQSTNESTRRLPEQSPVGSTNRTVGRPKAFYITVRLDHHIEEAVRYFQDVWGIKKVDRSAVVNAMLDDDKKWTDAELDKMARRIVGLLTSRLTS
jgi:hypothetical protein